VYIFRGRKVFRKFHDDAPSGESAAEEEQDDELSADDNQVRRQIGPEGRRPLTRSSIKPRLLFQTEIKERNRELGIDEDDEEAITDIEVPMMTPSKRKGKDAVQPPALEATPPPTVRKVKKGESIQPIFMLTLFTNMLTEVSFDSWSRVKSAHSSGSSSKATKKRSGEPLERDGADKRARSEHSTHVFIDSI
jgi:hypothetical protein